MRLHSPLVHLKDMSCGYFWTLYCWLDVTTAKDVQKKKRENLNSCSGRKYNIPFFASSFSDQVSTFHLCYFWGKGQHEIRSGL